MKSAQLDHTDLLFLNYVCDGCFPINLLTDVPKYLAMPDHGLSKQKIDDKLASLKQRGLIFVVPSEHDGDICYGMTDKAGEIYEQIFNFNWRQFVLLEHTYQRYDYDLNSDVFNIEVDITFTCSCRDTLIRYLAQKHVSVATINNCGEWRAHYWKPIEKSFQTTVHFSAKTEAECEAYSERYEYMFDIYGENDYRIY